MSEKVIITGIFVDPKVTVKATAPKTMTIERAVGKLLTDTTKNARTAYQLESLSVDDMTIQYCPAKPATAPLSTLGGEGLTALFTPRQSDALGTRLSNAFAAEAVLISLSKRFDVVEETNERLEKANERLEKQNESLKADITRLEQSHERLEAQNEKLDEDIQNLRNNLVEEKELRDEVCEGLRQITLLITPLHLRVLLDATRQKILQDLNVESWEALRGNRNAYELAHWLISTLSQQFASKPTYLPSLATFRFLCLFNNVRREGNSAAHAATPSQIKEAVQRKPLDSTDRKCLREMFIYAFKDSDI